MKIGYACLTVGVRNTNLRTCNLKSASEENLLALIASNIEALNCMIDYNIENKIEMFRISSDIIPFATLPEVNSIKWWDIFALRLLEIGNKINDSKMRVSMHPGQYTIINSPHKNVVERAILDLKYHTMFLDSLRVNNQHKVVIHIGGIYQDKPESIKRFINNYRLLDNKIKARLIIENDDKCYNICEVLNIAKLLKIPVVYDNLHNSLNPCDQDKSDSYWIKEAKKTWKITDGIPKVHYSQQDLLKQKGSHSETIKINEFLNYYNKIDVDFDVDFMLEVKDKNVSALKCINTILNQSIEELEKEWNRYKYLVLENSPKDYHAIEKLLETKDKYPVNEFYNLIEESFEQEKTNINSVNAALEVWECLKSQVTLEEELKFRQKIENLKNGKITANAIKNILWKIVVKYNQINLINSYYFLIR